MTTSRSNNATKSSIAPILTSTGEHSLPPDPLAQAIEDGDVLKLEKLLNAGTSVDNATRNGSTVLMRAAALGNLEITQILCERGANINARRADGFTALMFAAFFGHSEVVDFLVRKGADAEARSRFGTSAEMWASARGFGKIAKSLSIFQNPDNQLNSEKILAAPKVLAPPPRFAEAIEARPVVTSAFETPTTETRHFSSFQTATHVQESISAQITDPATTAEELPQVSPAIEFLASITSSWQRSLLLTVAVMLVCGGVTFVVLRSLSKQDPGTAMKAATDVIVPRELPVSVTKPVPVSSYIESKPAEVVPHQPEVVPQQPTTKSSTTDRSEKVKSGSTVKVRQQNAYRSKLRGRSSESSEVQIVSEAPAETVPAPMSVVGETAGERITPPTRTEAHRPVRPVQSDTVPLTTNRAKGKVIQWP